jgi:hypothetical protein
MPVKAQILPVRKHLTQDVQVVRVAWAFFAPSLLSPTAAVVIHDFVDETPNGAHTSRIAFFEGLVRFRCREFHKLKRDVTKPG